jgi:hypothetical protein
MNLIVTKCRAVLKTKILSLTHSIKQTANKRSTGNSQSINKNSELTLGSTSTNETNEKTFLQAMVFTGIPMDEINNFYITYKTQTF